MKKKRIYGMSFALGDMFPEKPGIFSKDIESEYDEFIRKRRLELKRSAISWKRENSLKNNRKSREER